MAGACTTAGRRVRLSDQAGQSTPRRAPRGAVAGWHPRARRTAVQLPVLTEAADAFPEGVARSGQPVKQNEDSLSPTVSADSQQTGPSVEPHTRPPSSDDRRAQVLHRPEHSGGHVARMCCRRARRRTPALPARSGGLDAPIGPPWPSPSHRRLGASNRSWHVPQSPRQSDVGPLTPSVRAHVLAVAGRCHEIQQQRAQ